MEILILHHGKFENKNGIYLLLNLNLKKLIIILKHLLIIYKNYNIFKIIFFYIYIYSTNNLNLTSKNFFKSNNININNYKYIYSNKFNLNINTTLDKFKHLNHTTNDNINIYIKYNNLININFDNNNVSLLLLPNYNFTNFFYFIIYLFFKDFYFIII